MKKSDTHEKALKGIKKVFVSRLYVVKEQMKLIEDSGMLHSIAVTVAELSEDMKKSAKQLRLAIEKPGKIEEYKK